MQDIFGSPFGKGQGPDLSWTVQSEDSVYKHRDLDRVAFPALPSDASG